MSPECGFAANEETGSKSLCPVELKYVPQPGGVKGFGLVERLAARETLEESRRNTTAAGPPQRRVKRKKWVPESPRDREDQFPWTFVPQDIPEDYGCEIQTDMRTAAAHLSAFLRARSRCKRCAGARTIVAVGEGRLANGGGTQVQWKTRRSQPRGKRISRDEERTGRALEGATPCGNPLDPTASGGT
ncbi:hypothetical protein K438DRAFT_1786618 [Mycena galopus ATCC 62051]|nr:hypothetical protein K438DRAFT_1786618 [Mycena galopus ATCC 62051]